MEKWRKVKLTDIIEFNPKEKILKGAIAKKVAMDKIQPFTRDIDQYELDEFKGGAKFKNGDTLVARITPCLENGKTAKVNFLAKDEVGFGSTEFIIVRAREGISDENFVYYLMCSPQIRKIAIKSMVGSSGRQRVQLDMLKNAVISCPSLTEQKKIGKIFKALDDKIYYNKKINHHLEQIAMLLFDKFFPNVTMGKNTVGEYIIPKRGKGLLSKDAVAGEFPIIAGGLQPAAYHNSANTKAPVITISASGANAGFVNLWTIPVWSSDSSFIDESITNNVYFWYIMLKKRQKEIYDAQTGSAQPHIYPKHITAMLTTELQTKEVEKFNEKIGPLFEDVGNRQKEITKLQMLRDTLLPRLMSSATIISSSSTK